jgi:hypothetical protein
VSKRTNGKHSLLEITSLAGINMGLPPEFSLLHSDLNKFLFATLGDERSGVPLTVLSALTRLNIDPWAEGARLSRLSREEAARLLVPLIASFPEEERTSLGVHAMAARLVELLPLPLSVVPPAPIASGDTRWTGRPAIWLFGLD